MDAGERIAQLRYLATTGRAVCCPTAIKTLVGGPGISVAGDDITKTITNTRIPVVKVLTQTTDVSFGGGVTTIVFDVSTGSMILPSTSSGIVSAIANLIITDPSAGEQITGVLYINDASAAIIDTVTTGVSPYAGASLTLMGTGSKPGGGPVPVRITLTKPTGPVGTVQSVQVQLLGNVALG